MTATLARHPWPAPSVGCEGNWRFARETAAPHAWRFDLRRQMSLTPRQLGQSYLMLCVLSLAVATGFYWHGARVVLAFSVLELLAVGAAMLLVARHAGDREIITLGSGCLSVERRVGPEVEHTVFRAAWVRVEPTAGDGSLLELSGEGRRVRIGRHVRPELRLELAQELRRALRLVRDAVTPVVDHELQASR